MENKERKIGGMFMLVRQIATVLVPFVGVLAVMTYVVVHFHLGH